eukprot:4937473-Pleurochrysis_carterae.AAC.1
MSTQSCDYKLLEVIGALDSQGVVRKVPTDDHISCQLISIPQWPSLAFHAASSFGGLDGGEIIWILLPSSLCPGDKNDGITYDGGRENAHAVRHRVLPVMSAMPESGHGLVWLSEWYVLIISAPATLRRVGLAWTIRWCPCGFVVIAVAVQTVIDEATHTSEAWITLVCEERCMKPAPPFRIKHMYQFALERMKVRFHLVEYQ